MPPGVKMAPYRFSTYIYKGQDLPKMDTFGWCDGFIKVALTLTLTRTLTPTLTNLKPKPNVHHYKHTLVPPGATTWKSGQFVRVRFLSAATQWGISVWRFRVFGYRVSSRG